MLNLTEVPRKILIIKPSALGDIVHTLPVLQALKTCYPGVEIHWVVAKGLHTFLEGHPLIHRLWIFDRQKWKRFSALSATLGEIGRFIRGLRAERFDVSLDFSGLLRSGVITWAAGAHKRLGFSNGDEGSFLFYNQTVHGDMKRHAVDRYLDLVRGLGCEVKEVVFPMPPFEPDPPVLRMLPPHFVVLAPSAGKEANRWPAERFGQIAARLPLPSVIIAGAAEQELAATVEQHSAGRAINLAGGTTLKELLAVISRACFVISNDTGPQHIAAALNVPVFSIFGPANPACTGPYGAMHTVIRKNIDCAPCYRWKPCTHWRCMQEISVDEVEGIINASGVWNLQPQDEPKLHDTPHCS
jgi:lipopolysaccharide heptosyltransferase I